MWYIILGSYLLISTLIAALLWFVLVVAKRGDKKTSLDFSEEYESNDS